MVVDNRLRRKVSKIIFFVSLFYLNVILTSTFFRFLFFLFKTGRQTEIASRIFNLFHHFVHDFAHQLSTSFLLHFDSRSGRAIRYFYICITLWSFANTNAVTNAELITKSLLKAYSMYSERWTYKIQATTTVWQFLVKLCQQIMGIILNTCRRKTFFFFVQQTVTRSV